MKGKYIRMITILCVVTILMIGAGTTSVTAEVPTLTLWDCQSTEFEEIAVPQYKQAEKELGIKLKITSIMWYDLIKRVMIAAKAGGLPDVISFWGTGITPFMAVNDYLVNLDPLIEKENGKKFKDQYVEFLLSRYNGKWYGLSQCGGSICLFWNKTYFAEAGLAGPPKNWDEYLEAAKKLTNPDKKRWGVAFDGADIEVLLWMGSFILQNGGRIGRVNGKIRINEPKALEATEWFLDLIRKHKVHTPGYVETTSPKAREMFALGEAAMINDGGWTVPFVARMEPSFDWGVAVLPKGKIAGGTSSGCDYAFGIPTTTTGEKRELAWKFIKWICSEPQIHRFLYWGEMVEKAKTPLEAIIYKNPFIPATKATYQAKDMLADPYVAPFLQQAMAPGFVSQYHYLPPQLDAALEFFKVEMQAAALGKQTAKEMLDKVAKEWGKMFKEWEDQYGPFTR